MLILGSEPVSPRAIDAFNNAFAPYGLPPTAIKPSYGIAEATLFVSTIAPTAVPTVAHLDRGGLEKGEAVRVAADNPDAAAHVSCGQIARSQWASSWIPMQALNFRTAASAKSGCMETTSAGATGNAPKKRQRTFGAVLRRRADPSHAHGAPPSATWLRTGDLGFHLDGELYVTGRIADLIVIDDRQLYPEDVEDTVADASSSVRRGYVAAFTVPSGVGEQLVVVAERASGTRRADPAPAVDAIRTKVAEPTRPHRCRCATRTGRHDPAHDERQVGPPGMPCRLPKWGVRGLARVPPLGSADDVDSRSARPGCRVGTRYA